MQQRKETAVGGKGEALPKDTQTGPTVDLKSVYTAHEHAHVAYLPHQSIARVNAALSAIHTLTGMLVQRERDTYETAEGIESDTPPLLLEAGTAMGMLEAIGCAAELIGHLTGNSPQWTEKLGADTPEADQLGLYAVDAVYRAHRRREDAYARSEALAAQRKGGKHGL